MGKLLALSLLLGCTHLAPALQCRQCRSYTRLVCDYKLKTCMVEGGGFCKIRRVFHYPYTETFPEEAETSCVQDCENDLDLSGPKAVSTYCCDHMDFCNDFAVLPDYLN